MSNTYISAKEFAEIIGVHYITVLEAVKKGEIRSIKVGRKFRIPKTELERWHKTKENTND